MTFIKHHKHHFGAFIILIAIALVSGYFAFSGRIQDTRNTTQTTTDDAVQDTASTTPDTDNKTQNTINKTQTTKEIKSDLTTTHGVKGDSQQFNNETPAVSALGGTAGQAIQQFNNPVIIKINGQDYQTEFTSSTTVYDLMTKLKSEDKISFSGKEYSGMGFFVDEINGVKNDNLAGKYWIYYVNGQSAQVGISNYIIKPNDLIEWKYENAKF